MPPLAAVPTDAGHAFGQAWPPFVLVAALLVLGLVAEREGVFRWTGALLERLPGPPVVLLAASLVAVAAVTAVLNLDTAVVFVTPVVVRAARLRGVDPLPVAYGSLVMANAASLVLPGANLTNLLVREADEGLGRRWLADVAPAGVAAALVSLLVLLAIEAVRRSPAASARGGGGPASPDRAERPGVVGVVAVAAAAAAVLVLASPALPVAGIALLAVGAARRGGRAGAREVTAAVGPRSLAALLVLVAALGTLARGWGGPSSLLDGAGAVRTAVVGAIAAVLVNNLPATALLTAEPPSRPGALLVGLGLGPNLFVTGSLAALLWWRTCRSAGVPVRVAGLLTRGPATAIPALVVAALLVRG